MEPITDTCINSLSGVQDTAQGYPVAYRSVYPEIYYKLMPFISMTCDLIFSYDMMPTQEKLEEMSDGIFDDFCKMYPDMSDYMGNTAGKSADPQASTDVFRTDEVFRRRFGGFRGTGFGTGFGGFRRRGLGRDLIYALLLSELLGRGGFLY
ncbi:MAG: hypothetical protein VB064_03520 [Oscillospiraceae bacterium]|nr:hypothetical protein [Oscillospiraceae bacterium]